MAELYGITDDCKENIRILAKALDTNMIKSVDLVVKGALSDLLDMDGNEDFLVRLTSGEIRHIEDIQASIKGG